MMKRWQRFKKYRHDQPMHRRHLPEILGIGVVVLLLGSVYWTAHHTASRPTLPPDAVPRVASKQPGQVLSIESVRSYTVAQAAEVARQDYGNATLPVNVGITKVTFRYSSKDTDGTPLVVYGRAYLPDDTDNHLPIFAFAPGTTGIGDECAPSLEQPLVANWANYDSHMIMYASQGYAAVTTDYEGMRDSSRLHHYMVGALEGRAVLDSIRALEHLPQAQSRLDQNNIFLGGYSQGGHAAFWADTINAQYAPEVKLKGVVGWGPVLNVKETLDDVTHAANINWFGPYVLVSFGDYYHHNYPVDQILQPPWTTHLESDVTSHCIDTDLQFWGHDPSKVYQPAFIQAMQTGNYTGDFAALGADLDRNAVGSEPTTTAKLINQGDRDNVVLPAQAESVFPSMCANSRGPVELKLYPGITHYDNMVHSFRDTLDWMAALRAGQAVPSTCPPA